MLETPFRDRVVIPLAKRLGWRCYFTWNSRNSPEGWPDLALVRPPQFIVAELKVTTDLSNKQEECLAALSACGIPCYVWRPEDVDEIQRILK